jgi:hypothetical protein
MPAIWTFGPENATGIDLSANAFWRVKLGAVFMYDMSWLALVAIYPPGPGQTIQNTQIVLARAGIPVAGKVEDVLRVAEVSVSTGTLEADTARMTEAFNLFKNNPRTKAETLEISLRDAMNILKAYWDVRDWLAGGASEVKTLDVSPFTIKLRP